MSSRRLHDQGNESHVDSCLERPGTSYRGESRGAGGRPAAPAPPAQLGALAPANLAKPRPKPPFDLTGTWQHDGRANTWRFVPETFKLTPTAQVHYDNGLKALKDGGVYRDDIGQCWPAGMPLIMTRVWPIAMMQLPTAIYMISDFENSVAHHLPRRPAAHTDPDDRRAHLQRRVDRAVGRRHAGRRHQVLPRPSPLDGSGRRLGAGQRGPAHHRALSDDRPMARWTSSTR